MNWTIQNGVRYAVAMSALLGLAACTTAEEDPAEHACEHAVEAGTAITAAIDGSVGPDVSTTHTRYDVTLGAVEGGNGGTVSLSADEVIHLLLFVGSDVPLVLKDASGNEVVAEASEAVTACSELAVMYEYPLGIGEYTITLGPTTETSVLLLTEHEDHEHEE